MKRTVALFICMITIISVLAGCGGAGTGSSAPASEAASSSSAAQSAAGGNTPPAAGDANGLLTPGELKVAMEIGYPPFEFYADDGSTPIGIDIELATAIAEELGLEVKFEDTAWDGIFSGLDIDKYDCVISAVTINPERVKAMEFSTPYIENWQAIVVKTGSDPVKSVEGLEGLTVGYQDATTSDEYLDELIQSGAVSCTVSEYDKVLNCFDDLRLGRINAVLCDSTVADGYISREPGVFEITWLQSSEEGAEAEKFGVAMKKGNTDLQAAVNKALATLDSTGKLDEIRKNWL
ncbi:cystine ABC transporter substrate-binding protein [Clostridia bacterium]|nr:cystine ABC transporter substrate-binding protein [Clostridia bacterium]